ncbi:cytochrome P450 302a1, mitochondrial-like [Dermatophagoides pteronyssinus]|uniref:Cytochrome P450 302a1, mitochondrial-like n=1 Tax=Dermatophagoides pteronyssinus TaxID=6956 RepID=A0A6P6Y3K0_DERPT|nr:cytochrome P450 302a1, mitochondrial-like [Dermatophagoides pteronyssinus]
MKTLKNFQKYRRFSSSSSSPSFTENVLETVKSFKEIPGPKPLPIIGNLWRYLPIIGEYSLERMYENGCYNLKHYGHIVREEISEKHKILHLFDPDHMESMFQQQQQYPYRRSHRALIKYRHERPDKYQSGGIFPENGDEWKRLRDLFKHYFLRPNFIQVYDQQLNEIVNDLIKMIRYERQKSNNYLNDDFQQFLYRWSLESICSIMLDARVGCLDRNNIDGAKMIDGGHKTLYAVMRTELYDGWEQKPTKDYECLVEGQDLMASVVEKYLNQRINAVESSSFNDENDKYEQTILEQLIRDPKITRKDLFGIVMDFIFAGIDTTSITAGFTLYFLAKNPNIQQRLAEELKQVVGDDGLFKAEHFNHTPLLKACVKETLRLRPISIGVGRLATNDMIIDGYHIPKNTMIITQNQVACQLPEYYCQPNEYQPDRWLGTNRNRQHRRYLYIPFGHGTRMCLGRRIAELELNILLANIIYQFRIECSPKLNIGQRTKLINLPDRPIKLQFIDRK